MLCSLSQHFEFVPRHRWNAPVKLMGGSLDAGMKTLTKQASAATIQIEE